MPDLPQIVFYHYAFSPYARRVQWYMLLRGLPYSECIQPPVLPRPDLARIGVRHRRIPVLAIGRDVYLDTRLMLRTLEQIPAGPAGSAVRPPLGVGSTSKPEQIALERLLDILTVETNVFLDSARLIPADVPAMKDPVFNKDRMDFFGGAPAGKSQPLPPPQASASRAPAGPKAPQAPKASPALTRAESLAEIRHAATLLESTLLADGRSWVLATPTPSLADIEAIWPFHWLSSMPGAFSDGSSASAEAALSPAQFPRLFAWIDRFNSTIRTARKAQAAQVTRIDGAKAAEAIRAAPYFGQEGQGVDASDPVGRAAGLKVGQPVVVWPTDTGVLHKDVGRLVRLAADEVVIDVAPDDGKGEASVRLHAPRHGFRVRPYEGDTEARL